MEKTLEEMNSDITAVDAEIAELNQRIAFAQELKSKQDQRDLLISELGKL